MALEAEFGVETTDKKIVNSLVYSATPAQVVGMLAAFNRDAAVTPPEEGP